MPDSHSSAKGIYLSVKVMLRLYTGFPRRAKKIDINGQWLAATTLLQTWMTSELDCVKVNEMYG